MGSSGKFTIKRTGKMNAEKGGEQRLLERVLKKRSGSSLMEEDLATEVDRRKINDKHKLIELAKVVIQEKKVDQDKLEVMLDKKFRKRIKESQTPVSTVMYDVTAPIWRNMCRAAIDGAARDLSVQQPNAKWVLAEKLSKKKMLSTSSLRLNSLMSEASPT